MAQDLIPISEGVYWFSIKTDEDQINILKTLCYYIIQGGGNGFDVDKVITLSKLKKTYTPCQLILKAVELDKNNTTIFKIYLYKIIALPKNERVKSFTLLSCLFNLISKKKIATDLEKKTKWWMNDISNEDFVKKIIENNDY